MKEISRELLDEIFDICDTCIDEGYDNQKNKVINKLNRENVEIVMKSYGIKIIEPDYLARAKEREREAEAAKNFQGGFYLLRMAIGNYKRYIKKLQEETNEKQQTVKEEKENRE